MRGFRGLKRGLGAPSFRWYLKQNECYYRPVVARARGVSTLGRNGLTDSTIAPSQNQRFSFANVSSSRLLDTRKDTIENKGSIYFLVLQRKTYRSMASGCPGTPCFRRYDRELVSKSTISVKKCWGDYRGTTHLLINDGAPRPLSGLQRANLTK